MVSKEQAISAAKLIDSLYYYTPSIEDIHVGYECEIYNANSEWFPITITLGHIFNDLLFYTRDISKELTNLFRTPYLTKEQIEEEGWLYKNNSGLLAFQRTKPELHSAKRINNELVFLKYNLNNHQLTFMKNSGIIYDGVCPSINEFRKIVKLLGIVK